MQVHAVPDSDKAFDASGRKLPWAYDVDTSRLGTSDSREPIEKGPFGRSQRRSRSGLSRSRSKTAEPRREEDRIKAEQIAAEDAVFGSLRKKETAEGGKREALGEVDGNAQVQATANGGGKGEVEATEVLLYGFGEELQWAALDHYERVGGGSVLEDYDRQPPGQRFDVSRSFSKATSQRSLTRAALRKKNTFAGGLHWIKVTFDSRGAAELACARSPHVIKGHLVYAEPYLGRGPGKDEAILASQAGAQITDDVLPTSFSTNVVYPVDGGSPERLINNRNVCHGRHSATRGSITTTIVYHNISTNNILKHHSATRVRHTPNTNPPQQQHQHRHAHPPPHLRGESHHNPPSFSSSTTQTT